MAISFSEKLPSGSITQYAGAFAPSGWLLMFGQSLAVADYAALFDAIGYTFGGSGANFNVPDARGRVLFGKDNMGGAAANRVTSGGGGVDGAALGAVGGGETKTLTLAQTPSHRHTESMGHSIAGGSGSSHGQAQGGSFSSSAVSYDGYAGSSGQHSIMPPALVINYIIKT